MIEHICAHLEAITDGTFLAKGLDNRLLINVPPGFMKSLLTSVFWPAWEWGPAGQPHLRYLTTSFSDRFAWRDSRKHRDLVASEWYQARWPEVALTRSGETSFSNSAQGGREAVAFVSLTGGRGDRVILDDPHSTEMAESDMERERTTRVFRESLTERLNDKVRSAIVVIMQRLHENDISGQIIQLGMPYQHVMIPMEFEPERAYRTAIRTDPRTEDGALAWAERFPRAQVDRDKKALGSYAVAGQYQQRPQPRGGLLFKRSWFQYLDAPPLFGVTWARGWDLAASTDASAARTAGVKIGITVDKRIIIANGVAIRGEDKDVQDLIVNTAKADGPGCMIDIPQDPGQAGKVQAAAYVRLLNGFIVFVSPETGDKVTRARPLAAQAEAGNVYLVKGPWNEEFIAEMVTFPTGRLKDYPDAASRAYGRLVLTPGMSTLATPVLVTAPRPTFGDHPGA